MVKHDVNLGIAVAAERGLLVPNVKHAGDLSLPELARALQSPIAIILTSGRARSWMLEIPILPFGTIRTTASLTRSLRVPGSRSAFDSSELI